jgi:glutamate-ammonia-ligase adenylyltransferase
MSGLLGQRLQDVLAGSVLGERVALIVDPFVGRRGGDDAAAALDGARLLGLARALTTNVDAARFLAHRPLLLERIAAADEDALSARGVALEAAARAVPEDLEGALDGLRLLRRDETLFAATLGFGGVVAFEAVSVFLSQLAEVILAQCLSRAQRSLPAQGAASSLAVLGMGKVGGREFTFHSDLDLIFLCSGGMESLGAASRAAQRLISYLTTRTGAGVAYAVDSRLRPSGNQGLLVTTLESFARYQRHEAQTWEHLALMRARVVAGDASEAGEALAAVQRSLVGRGAAPWAEVADMRRKIEAQRANEEGGKIPFKTGAGGLMDIDFLAAGATLECDARRARPRFPSNAALLRAAAPGPGTERLLHAYAFLRHVEACARWVLGRPAEAIETARESFPLIAALALPEEPRDALVAQVNEVRRAIRAAFDAVAQAASVGALRMAAPD